MFACLVSGGFSSLDHFKIIVDSQNLLQMKANINVQLYTYMSKIVKLIEETRRE